MPISTSSIKAWNRLRSKVDSKRKVRLGHIPRWLDKRIAEWFKSQGIQVDRFLRFREFCRKAKWNPDHFGSSDGGKIFVDEPYPSRYGDPIQFDDETARRIAKLLRLKLKIIDTAFSTWKPGQTCRYEFREPRKYFKRSAKKQSGEVSK